MVIVVIVVMVVIVVIVVIVDNGEIIDSGGCDGLTDPVVVHCYGGGSDSCCVQKHLSIVTSNSKFGSLNLWWCVVKSNMIGIFL